MTDPVEDAELLRRHVEGDPDAFGELVRRHRDRLWAIALRTLGDREEAADALQDAFVSAFRAAHTFQGRSAVTTWLHRIVVNACLDRARRSSTRRTRLVEDETVLETAAGHDEGADVSAERGELRRELATALATLPGEQRAALVLVDMEGYSVAEAAAVLDVPAGTIKSRCARARAKLLPHLSHLRVDGRSDAAGSSRSGSTAAGSGNAGSRSSSVTREAVDDLGRPPEGNPTAASHVPSPERAETARAAGGELKA
ncbi:RNA polymerase sigma factor SigM [Streptacidiphilus anmyonensis]|uniref:RNA polymerase sigma factor SigM n=1 Tax=Streptacidiphilus anmyonensis TaxID=405782 RepID=UPI000B077038|nr:RNA polymerase sigma factor SigM [Streptacidiphilus anmyonensis]